MSEKWKNKIVSHKYVDPKELVPNLENWRLHPEQQGRVVSAALEEVGWIQSVIVNKTTGRIVDGHLRVALALERGEVEVPVVYVELTEEEERKALATLDPIGELAGCDRQSYERLVEGIQTDSLDLRQFMQEVGLKGGKDENEDDEGEDETVPKDIPEMELHPFEHYDYIMLLFKTDQDFYRASELLQLKKTAFPLPGDGKPKVGTGRVIDGVKALEILQGVQDESKEADNSSDSNSK